MALALGRVIHSDPAGPLTRPRSGRSIFDGTRAGFQPNACQRFELKEVPDRLLIATLISSGCPAWAAYEVSLDSSGRSRFLALQHWCLVQDAREGERGAKNELDRRRQAWSELRKLEYVADRPGHTVGFGDR